MLVEGLLHPLKTLLNHFFSSGQEGSFLHRHMFSLSISSTWPYATPFAEIIQSSLKRINRHLSTRSPLSFIRTPTNKKSQLREESGF